MPYNTRRKSLSLPSLGIQLPKESRPHRPSIAKVSPVNESPPQQPPTKKRKQSHTSNSPSPISPSRPRSNSSAKVVSFADRPKSNGRAAYENTPPPSPRSFVDNKIETEGINDDIVVGVVEQLAKTGNRPHLIKELATVLSNINDAVLSSANPAALLSSRLSAYLKRPWSALSPCPLDKELTTVHPRKVYYFLTTLPRQPLPADSSDIFSSHAGGKGGRRIISPSISSASIDEDPDAAEERKRDAMSPSPELDFGTEDLDIAVAGAKGDFVTPPTPAGSSFSGRSSLARDGSNGSSSDSVLSHNHRAASPPLEGDEKEFTQTATSMRMRGMSLDDPTIRPSTEDAPDMEIEETEEIKARRNREAAEALFGTHTTQGASLRGLSSPLVKPAHQIPVEKEIKSKGEDVEMEESMSILGDSGASLTWDTREPEDIQIEDLDDLFGAF
ncbi:hypothetical protein P7C71_g847, partial [Lecanoromycetidae sp. Uapishka_2]